MRDSNSEQLGEHETDFELGVRLLAGIMEDRRNQVRSDRRCVCEAVDLDGGYQSELGTSKTGEGSFSQDDPQDRNNFGGGMRSSVSKTIDNHEKGRDKCVGTREDVVTYRGAPRSSQYPQRLLDTEWHSDPCCTAFRIGLGRYRVAR